MLRLVDFACPGRLGPLTLTVPAGQVVALIGPNGSGKSSLLLGLANLLPTRGEAWLREVSLPHLDMPSAARLRALLPQRQGEGLPMPCYQVLLLGASALGGVSPPVMMALEQLIVRLELEPLLSRDFSQLSGGEQQRLLLAKTLLQIWPACNPQGQLLLLDEPLSGLDWHHQIQVLTLLGELARQGLTVLVSIHDFNLASCYADRLLCLQAGKLVAQGEVGMLDEALIQRVFQVRTERLVHAGRQVFMPLP